MALNSFFSIFLPKEEKFYPQFKQMADDTLEAAQLFTQLVSETDLQKRQDLQQQIKVFETHCDEIVQEIFTDLNNTFVAPFDREDIHELCDALDDVMDYINSATKRIILYQPKTMPNKAMHMAEIILQGVKALVTAAEELPHIRKRPQLALEQCDILHSLEHEGDDVFDNFVKELFEIEADARELIKIKEIMQSMEEATDRANYVGRTLRTIIIKYA